MFEENELTTVKLEASRREMRSSGSPDDFLPQSDIDWNYRQFSILVWHSSALPAVQTQELFDRFYSSGVLQLSRSFIHGLTFVHALPERQYPFPRFVRRALFRPLFTSHVSTWLKFTLNGARDFFAEAARAVRRRVERFSHTLSFLSAEWSSLTRP